MASLFLRNLMYTILMPGLVAGLIPYLIVRDELNKDLFPLHWFHYLGVILFVIGLVVLIFCIFKFAIEGRGTLSPTDPTKRLVVTGLYRFSRNPMYIGVIIMLIGEAIFTLVVDLWIYSGVVFLLFNFFIMTIEEPRLKKDFVEEYKQYCIKVMRWI